MKITNLFLLALLCLTGSGCDSFLAKEPDSNVLPPYTQEGKNTFGFMIGDTVFVAKMCGTLTGTACGGTIVGDTTAVIGGSNCDFSLQIMIDSFKTGQYVLPNDSLSLRFSLYSGVYRPTVGKVNLSYYNKESRILSGTFDFEFVDYKQSKVIVKEGRFDVKADSL